jgi:oligopeptide/dipeptide ABC transporter ATP-binding protein
MSELLRVQGLGVRFALRSGWLRPVRHVQAVADVSLHVQRGETLAVVGESGSGKTSLARAVVGLAPAWRGQIHFDGADVLGGDGTALSRLRREVQMVFQDPFGSLDPRLSVQDIVAEPLRIHRTHDAAAQRKRVLELLDQVGLPAAAAQRYPHQFSGGQRQRIAIARALAPQPQLIIADEPLSALDVSIQSQVMNLMSELRARLGLSYLLVSHDFAAVHHLADRIAVMYLGRIVETAPVDALFESPAHPYTAALLASVPRVGHGKRKPGSALSGELPSPVDPPEGCPFHPRCPLAADRCKMESPHPVSLQPGRTVACHFPLALDASHGISRVTS